MRDEAFQTDIDISKLTKRVEKLESDNQASTLLTPVTLDTHQARRFIETDKGELINLDFVISIHPVTQGSCQLHVKTLLGATIRVCQIEDTSEPTMDMIKRKLLDEDLSIIRFDI
jgi:hypothetical protein